MRPFLTALFIVLLALAGVAAWLYMEQGATIEQLRSDADRSAVSALVDIGQPPPQAPAAVAPASDPRAPDPQAQDLLPDELTARVRPENEQPGGGQLAGGLGTGATDEPQTPDSVITIPGAGTASENGQAADDQPDGDRLSTTLLIPELMQRPEPDVSGNPASQDSGDQVAGGQNSGGQNSGDQNSGDQNSGDQNSGDQNSGDQVGESELAALPELADIDPGAPSSSPAALPPTTEQPQDTPATQTPAPQGPYIALVILDLGQSSAATESAIQRLPGAVTLAFSPYATTLSRWIPQARAAGHEVLIMVPMEPVSYPRDDPGPQTLLTSLTAETNLGRLDWALARAEGYVGVVNNMGSRMTASRDSITPVLQEIRNRDLIFLDSRTASNSVVPAIAGEIGLPIAVNDRFIDRVASRDQIDQQLAELEAVALQRGYAVGLAGSYPVTFERIAAWLPTLEEKGITLAPISSVANGTVGPQAGAGQ